ncbi:MAG: hypothetical protein HN712_14660 [Gemmatimonadetes bacterium]|nr:hypothetical protein [Gemmatimonadota bacterium]MBT6148923.1 hypothetical protein [Gemmatimonadota bacterium]MBT7861559.1 hypothetical protein [Gemmatimonadota bacterium]
MAHSTMAPPPWRDVLASNWQNAGQATLLTDMSRCSPASALSDRMAPGCWRVVAFEAGGISGKMILACQDSGATPVALPLEATGAHAIFVGIYATRTCPSDIWLKLDSDVAALSRTSQPAQGMWSIEEVFLKVAELDATCLQVIQQMTGVTSSCGVAYVKLIPLSDDEHARYKAESQSGRPLTATCDGFSFLCTRSPRTREEVIREIEPYRQTDFSTLLLHLVHGDTVRYPSPYQQSSFTEAQCHPSAIYGHGTEALRALEAQGINYARVLIEGAHEMGLKVHAGLRPGGWTYYHPYADMMRSSFYEAHPEWRTIDRDGTPVARMSWAVEQVRTRMIDALMDAVALGADGAHIVFNRGLPAVLYEPPFCDLFQARHGESPQALDEADERILSLRCEILARFMAELRARLDQEQKQRRSDQRLSISVCVLGTEHDNRRYGIDIRQWAQAGLVDEVHIYRYNFGQTRTECDMPFFRTACAPHGVHISPMFSPNVDMDTCGDEAATYYDEGASGLGVWDAFTGDAVRRAQWNRLGHPGEVRQRLVQGPTERVFLPIHKIDGEVLDGAYPIFWGG